MNEYLERERRRKVLVEIEKRQRRRRLSMEAPAHPYRAPDHVYLMQPVSVENVDWAEVQTTPRSVNIRSLDGVNVSEESNEDRGKEWTCFLSPPEECKNPLSSSDDEEMTHEDSAEQMIEGLREWAAAGVSDAKVNSLLDLLKRDKCFKFLPSDVRTLQKSPRSVPSIERGSGSQVHMGLKVALERALERRPNSGDIFHQRSPASNVSNNNIMEDLKFATSGTASLPKNLEMDKKLDMILDKIGSVQMQLTELTGTVKKIVGDSRGMSINDKEIEFDAELIFPLRLVSSVDELVSRMKADKKYRDDVVEVLRSQGGKSLGRHIYNMLYYALVDELAVLYTYKGQSKIKLAFQSTELCTAMFDAVRSRPIFKDTDKSSFAGYMSEWFRQANFRLKRSK